jgi:hypothetical protein
MSVWTILLSRDDDSIFPMDYLTRVSYSDHRTRVLPKQIFPGLKQVFVDLDVSRTRHSLVPTHYMPKSSKARI